MLSTSMSDDVSGDLHASQTREQSVPVDYTEINEALICRSSQDLDPNRSLRELLNKYPKTNDVEEQKAVKQADGADKNVKNASKPPSKHSERGVCVGYWFIVLSISCLIAFSIWLSVQIGLKHARMMASRGMFSLCRTSLTRWPV